MLPEGSACLRLKARRSIAAAVYHAARDLDASELAEPAVIFAPHPDDETLACGGTIIKKLAAGADVTVAFMSDGGSSHSHLMPPEELGEIRKREAEAAARALGLDRGSLVFLGLPSRRLGHNLDAARRKVAELLERRRPSEVFVPYHREGHDDHVATNEAVLSAVRGLRRSTDVYEYPIWFWSEWPWVNAPLPGARRVIAHLKGSIRSGVLALKDFRRRVRVADVLDRKRAALDCYASQMTRLIPDPRWATLGEVAGGEFLQCLFQDYELFRRYNCAR